MYNITMYNKISKNLYLENNNDIIVLQHLNNITKLNKLHIKNCLNISTIVNQYNLEKLYIDNCPKLNNIINTKNLK